jgi:hypothetical protein
MNKAEVFENGNIIISRCLNETTQLYRYSITVNNFAQIVLEHEDFDDLKELMDAFRAEDLVTLQDLVDDAHESRKRLKEWMEMERINPEDLPPEQHPHRQLRFEYEV